MANKVILKASDGTTVEFYDEIKAQGGVKDVYFSIDKTYVVAFYRKTLSPSDKNRLENIVGPYHKRIFETVEGKYWKDYLIMPDRLVEWNGKIGVVLPFYPSKYFFKGGPFDGKEKEGKFEIENIGMLFLNEDGNISFEPCEAGILTPDFYGLGGFDMLPIAQIDNGEQQNENQNVAMTVNLAKDEQTVKNDTEVPAAPLPR